MNERVMSGERDLPSEVLELLHRGHKIDAVNQLRKAWRIDTREAKHAIDRYEQTHAIPRHEDPTVMITEEHTGLKLLLAIVLALALAAGYFFFA